MTNKTGQRRPTVLITDDDADASRVIVKLLQKKDYRLLTAFSGPEALEVLGREHVDVVVLDVMMPGMDGLEVCRVLRSEPRYAELPIILLTGLDDFKTRHEGMKLGVSQFMCKPFTRQDLVDRIEAQLRVRRISDELDTIETRLS